MPVSWELVPQLLYPGGDPEPQPDRWPVTAKDVSTQRQEAWILNLLTLDKSLSSWPRVFCLQGPCNSQPA